MKLRRLFTAGIQACLILIHNRALTRYKIHFKEYFVTNLNKCLDLRVRITTLNDSQTYDFRRSS